MPVPEQARRVPPQQLEAGAAATIMIVDDEPEVLAALRRLLRLARPRWRTVLATTGPQALELLADQPVDVVLADIQMPGMDGLRLLDDISAAHPEAGRIVFTGQTELSMVSRAFASAHQVLAKPCRHDLVIGVLDRILGQRGLLPDPATRRLLVGARILPRPAELIDRLQAATVDGRADPDRVAEVVQTDLASCADVLRMACSPLFGPPSPVDSILGAVSRLGAETVQAVLLALAAESARYCADADLAGASLAAGTAGTAGTPGTASTALPLACAARDLARREGWPPDAVSAVFAAALLDRIGDLLLDPAAPGYGADPAAPGCGADPAAAGRGAGPAASARLLALWGFPRSVVDAVNGQDPSPASELVRRLRRELLGARG